MPGFVAEWLLIWVCTWGAVIYHQQPFGHSHASSSMISLLALETVALVAWALYWMVLYPAYFTPFRHLPTPPVCADHDFTFLELAQLRTSQFRGERCGAGTGNNFFQTMPGMTFELCLRRFQAGAWFGSMSP